MAYKSGMTSKRGAHRGSGFLRIDASELLDMARRCEQELGADAAAATLATALGLAGWAVQGYRRRRRERIQEETVQEDFIHV